MFKIVSHSDNGGFHIKIKRGEEKVRVKEFFCEKCQKQFNSKQALLLHNLKVHK